MAVASIIISATLSIEISSPQSKKNYNDLIKLTDDSIYKIRKTTQSVIEGFQYETLLVAYVAFNYNMTIRKHKDFECIKDKKTLSLFYKMGLMNEFSRIYKEIILKSFYLLKNMDIDFTVNPQDLKRWDKE
jgi:hypothetical protein